MSTVNSFGARTALQVGDRTFQIYSLPALEAAGFPEIASLPYSMKILLENLLRQEDGRFVKKADIEALARWDLKSAAQREISFAPARVLLQDFTGVPAVVDLAAMRDGIARLGGNPDRVNPLQPVELVIDHSVQVDYFGRPDAFQLNAELEFSRNKERYAFLRWGQNAFRNFRVVPPDTGIVHQVNIEYLARVVVSDDTARRHLRVSRHARRHRLAYDDGQRPGRGGMGRGRHRGGGRDARPADLDAHPAGPRRPPVRHDARRRDGDRSRADRDGEAAQARRGRQVRRVLRRRARPSDDCGSRDARQHVSRVRRDDRDLPDRRDDARLPAADGARRVARGAGRGVRQGAGTVPQPRRSRSEVLRNDRHRSRDDRAEPRRAEAAAGSRLAQTGQERISDGAGLDAGIARRRRARKPAARRMCRLSAAPPRRR